MKVRVVVEVEVFAQDVEPGEAQTAANMAVGERLKALKKDGGSASWWQPRPGRLCNVVFLVCRTPGVLNVRLASVGNPDYGQDFDNVEGLPGVQDQEVDVKDLAEAGAVCRRWIEENDLGGGNWAGGQVTDENGVQIAQVSYNGRVWPPGPWHEGMKPLYG